MVFQGCIMRSRSLDTSNRSNMAIMPRAPRNTNAVMTQWTSQFVATQGWANPSVNRVMPALLKAETL